MCVCARESEREKEKGMIHWEKGKGRFRTDDENR